MPNLEFPTNLFGVVESLYRRIKQNTENRGKKRSEKKKKSLLHAFGVVIYLNSSSFNIRCNSGCSSTHKQKNIKKKFFFSL